MAGGTWLALREDHVAVALLNRRNPLALDSPAERRSRGLLTLDVATAPAEPAHAGAIQDLAMSDDRAQAALQRAWESIERWRYAPFTLVFLSPTGCWMVSFDGHRPIVAPVPEGWHVLTHSDLDDPDEPRTAHLLARLSTERPASLADAEALVTDLLRAHGDERTPAVCLHQGVMQTVSSSWVWMDETAMRYRHAEGRPCEHPFEDLTSLLAGAAPSEKRA